jgi:alpha-N-arabinofuranosidase
VAGGQPVTGRSTAAKQPADVHPLARPTNATPATAEITVSTRQRGRISPYLFGSNLLWPYNAEGAFDAATGRFFPAFVKEVEQLGTRALRYPAGITADSFDWWRAIGPQATRQPNEPYGMQDGALSHVCCALDGPVASTVGPDEFGRLLDQTGAIGDIVVNFVTGSPQEAADFVAYMTAPQSAHPSRSPDEASYWAALRAKNGHPAPYPVPYWEVGNEQDGPGQLGWRSGTVISVGPHNTYCPAQHAKVCLYAFGGTTAFVGQRVGTFADDRPGHSQSTGAPYQRFFVYFPPIAPGSQVVYVAGQAWAPVKNLLRAGPRAQAYQVDPATGEIIFGNGEHGAIPPRHAEIRASYFSGPHGGFVQFYNAMKKMSSDIKVCETEESDITFLQAMGRVYPYDCVELHRYARPVDPRAPMLQYEEALMYWPVQEGADVSALQEAIHRYSGKNIPVVLTEYGQLVVPMPFADPDFNLSLDQGVLVASQLRQWVQHNLPLAEKYLLNSIPFLGGRATELTSAPVGLSVDNAMVAGRSPSFVMEPTGEVLAIMSALAGAQRLSSAVIGDPVMAPGPGQRVPVLQPLAAASRGRLELIVINVSPTATVRARVRCQGLTGTTDLSASLLDGPSPTAYNSFGQPDEVGITAGRGTVQKGSFWWTFPAHSVTLLELGASSPIILPQPTSIVAMGPPVPRRLR